MTTCLTKILSRENLTCDSGMRDHDLNLYIVHFHVSGMALSRILISYEYATDSSLSCASPSL
jgi:hypothetical protein